MEIWEGDAPAAWAARWRVPWLEVHDRIGSTNDRARELAEAGAEPFTTVIAEEQTAGRGREGRRWESPAGSGLLISVVAPPSSTADRAVVPLRAGIATCRALERAAPGVRATLKWPNDVLIEGRKVSGILCEAAPQAIVIGIGINVRRGALDHALTTMAVALDEAVPWVASGAGSGAVPTEVDRAELAGHLIGDLRELVGAGGPPLEGLLRRELDERDALRGRLVGAAAGETGVARGIDTDGALLVEVGPGETRRVVAGDVRIRE